MPRTRPGALIVQMGDGQRTEPIYEVVKVAHTSPRITLVIMPSLFNESTCSVIVVDLHTHDLADRCSRCQGSLRTKAKTDGPKSQLSMFITGD